MSKQFVENHILRALPESEYKLLSPYLTPTFLSCRTIIHEPGEDLKYGYFPNSAMISLVSIMGNGNTTEIGLIGNEGIVGLPIILGGNRNIGRAIVQIEGTALRIEADYLKQAFQQGETIQKILLLYTQARLTQVAQTAACNRQHTIEARLARWLLSVYDCVLQDELLLTQEFIANMLGTRRSGVTVAANNLQKAGIIKYSRGKITILNRTALENTSCECYRLVQNEFIRLLGTKRG